MIAAGPDSAIGWYRAALATMQTIREPAYLTYRTSVPAGPTTIGISRDDSGRAEMSVVDGKSEAQSWDVAYRSSDGTAAFALADGARAISHLAILDPTWRGAYAWMRHGISSEVGPVQAPEPHVSSSPEEAPPLPVVAFVQAIADRNYELSDGGDAACADGRPGHRVWTHARGDALAHPLAQAVIDRSTLQFCTLVLREHTANQTLSLDLEIELHFGKVGEYYLTTDGKISGAVRPYKRPGWFPLHTSFRYDAFTFPETLAPELFALPPA